MKVDFLSCRANGSHVGEGEELCVCVCVCVCVCERQRKRESDSHFMLQIRINDWVCRHAKTFEGLVKMSPV